MSHALSTTASHPKVGVFNLGIALQRASPVCEAGQCTKVPSLMHANILELLGFGAFDYQDHIYGQMYILSTVYRLILRILAVTHGCTVVTDMLRWFAMCKLYKHCNMDQQVCTDIPQQPCASFMRFWMRERAIAICARCSCMFQAQKVSLPFLARRSEQTNCHHCVAGAWSPSCGGTGKYFLAWNTKFTPFNVFYLHICWSFFLILFLILWLSLGQILSDTFDLHSHMLKHSCLQQRPLDPWSCDEPGKTCRAAIICLVVYSCCRVRRYKYARLHTCVNLQLCMCTPVHMHMPVPLRVGWQLLLCREWMRRQE